MNCGPKITTKAESASDLRRALELADKLTTKNAELRATLSESRDVIAGYWPISTPESAPEKSTIAILNKIDAALRR